MTDQARTVKQQFHDAAHQHSELWQQVQGLERKIKRMEKIMAGTQADVDALTQAVSADVSKIQAEIASLQSANPSLDLSGLQAAVASLDATANGGSGGGSSAPPAGGSDGGSSAPPADGSGSGSPAPSA